MDKQLLFNFKTELSKITIISKLNNPFEIVAPEIAKIAAKEFQEFITEESKKWKYDFAANKGKMFGILVVQQEDGAYSYIGTVSGKLPNNATCNKFIPSVFDRLIYNQLTQHNLPEVKNPAVNISEDDLQFMIEFAVPGRAKDDFIIEAKDDILTVSLETEQSDSDVINLYYKKEFDFTT